MGNARNKSKLWCPWCEHIDTYLVAKFDQPKCTQSGRYVPKERK